MPSDDPVEVRAVVSFDKEFVRDAATQDERNHATQNSIKNATWWAFGAVAAYAVVTTFMWCAMIKQNKIASTALRRSTESFRTDERAWMGFKFMEGQLTLTQGKSFLVPTQLINVGKTPAQDTQGDVVVGVFKNGEKLNFDYSPGHAHYHVFAGTIFPTGTIAESFEAIKHGEKEAQSIIMTPDLLKGVFQGDDFIVVHGRITYNDIFGIAHWTTYCRYVLHPEKISEECMRYNETDSNDKNPN